MYQAETFYEKWADEPGGKDTILAIGRELGELYKAGEVVDHVQSYEFADGSRLVMRLDQPMFWVYPGVPEQ